MTDFITGFERMKKAGIMKKHRLLFFMVILIVIKQLLVIGLPLFAHAGAGHDDRLMINMASSLINGEWLGSYSEKTLVKGIFFPLFLAVNHFLGIPYTFSVPGFYSLACIVFIYGIKKLFQTEFPLYIIFFVLIFNPISFADETFLRVYRNCLTASQVLIVSGGMFAIYLNRFEKKWRLLCWSFGAGLGLASLWHTREDGIWMVALIMGVIIITGISIIAQKRMKIFEKSGRILITVIPVALLMLSTFVISSINYSAYGIYTTNELNSSNFTQAIKLIYSVEATDDVQRASVPRSTMEKIYNVSPTLNSIRGEVEASLDRWSWYDKDAKVRQVEDGFFFWALREAVANAGYYENAQKANTFFGEVAKELEAGFESGQLSRRAPMPSALMSPWRGQYAKELPGAFLKTMTYVVTFNAVETTLKDSIDDGKNGIQLFEEITNNPAKYPGEPIQLRNQIRFAVLNFITGIYQLLGGFIFLMSLVGYAAISLGMIFKKSRQKFDLLDSWLVLSALLFSAAVLAMGVAYTDISAYVAISYWYLAGAYPLLLVFNVLSLYKIAEISVKMTLKKNPGKKT